MPTLDPAVYDPREVPCPYCGAKKTGWCKRPSGHSGPFVSFHADRVRDAEETWRQEERDRYGEVRSGFLRPAGTPEPGKAGSGCDAQLALFP